LLGSFRTYFPEKCENLYASVVVSMELRAFKVFSFTDKHRKEKTIPFLIYQAELELTFSPKEDLFIWNIKLRPILWMIAINVG
jgi:hypothetical protein